MKSPQAHINARRCALDRACAVLTTLALAALALIIATIIAWAALKAPMILRTTLDQAAQMVAL